MRTHAIEWSPTRGRDSRIVLNPGHNLPHGLSRSLAGILSLASRALLATVLALAIVVGAAWLVTLPDFAVYLQAALWAGGFVFVALAVESNSPLAAILQLATGIVLPVLAWLSSRSAVELAVVAAALVAAWMAAGIFRR
jgi:hypothetical protein